MHSRLLADYLSNIGVHRRRANKRTRCGEKTITVQREVGKTAKRGELTKKYGLLAGCVYARTERKEVTKRGKGSVMRVGQLQRKQGDAPSLLVFSQ